MDFASAVAGFLVPIPRLWSSYVNAHVATLEHEPFEDQRLQSPLFRYLCSSLVRLGLLCLSPSLFPFDLYENFAAGPSQRFFYCPSAFYSESDRNDKSADAFGMRVDLSNCRW